MEPQAQDGTQHEQVQKGASHGPSHPLASDRRDAERAAGPDPEQLRAARATTADLHAGDPARGAPGPLDAIRARRGDGNASHRRRGPGRGAEGKPTDVARVGLPVPVWAPPASEGQAPARWWPGES